jgi:hypothetical protein
VIVPTGNQYGCNQFKAEDLPTTSKTMFIMVRRGQCDNPTKVRNVQSIGGAVALIADYQEESLEDLVMEQTS